MNTKYSKISENSDFVLLDVVIKNEPDYQNNINDSTISGRIAYMENNQLSVYNDFIENNQLLHHSMGYKLRHQSSRQKFQVLQKWEGTVEEIDGETIHVSLKIFHIKGLTKKPV